MPASYPTSIKVWSPTEPGFEYPEDLKTVVYARHVVTIYDEVTAVQQQLGAGGVATSGTWGGGTFSSATTAWGSLRARLQNIEEGVYESFTNRVKTAGGSSIVSSSSTVGLSLRTSGSGNLLELRNTSNTLVNRFAADGTFFGVIDGGTA